MVDGLQIETDVGVARQKPRDRIGQDAERQAGQRGNAKRRTRADAQIAARLAQRADAFLNVGDIGEQGVRVLDRKSVV